MVKIDVENLCYTYQSKYQKVEALRDVSCCFESGKFYAIIGQSGSGKTTLLSMLAALGTPSEGTIKINGTKLQAIGNERHRRENISVIYQAFNLFPKLTALENVQFSMRIGGKPKEEAETEAKQLLLDVSLKAEHYNRFPAMLSGGEQQRVAIARALGSKAKTILADEPTGNLDTENGGMVVDILRRLTKDKGYCVIVVTHDRELAATADIVYRMKDGRLESEE